MKQMLTNLVSACMLNFAQDAFYVNAVTYVLVNAHRDAFLYTVCIHSLAGFSVCSFYRLASIHKSFVCNNLDINGYAQSSIHKFINGEICEYGKSAQYNPQKMRAHTVYCSHSQIHCLMCVCIPEAGMHAIKKDVDVLLIP